MSRRLLYSAGPGAVAALLAVLVVQLLSVCGWFSPDVLPAPSAIAVQMLDELTSIRIWQAIGLTLLGWLVGLLIAMAAGLALGFVVGSCSLAFDLLKAPLEFLRPIPPVALIPALVLIYGDTISTKIALVALGAVWPILIQTIYGVREIDKTAIDLAAIYRFPKYLFVTRVLVPGALPSIFVGLRTGASIGLIAAIAAELIAGVAGLGREIGMARSSIDLAPMYALITISGVIGVVVSALISLLRRSLLFWHASEQGNQL